jgi:hypothetical protein
MAEASIGANDASSNNLKGSEFHAPALELQRVTPAARSHSARSACLCRVEQAHLGRAQNLPPGEHGQGPPSRARETDLRNIPGSKRAVKNVLRLAGRGRSICRAPTKCERSERLARRCGVDERGMPQQRDPCLDRNSKRSGHRNPLDLANHGPCASRFAGRAERTGSALTAASSGKNEGRLC